LRSIGLALLAISGTVVAAPVALPATVVTVAGYVAVAGGVLSAVSQITTSLHLSAYLGFHSELVSGSQCQL
jgi:energy-converting hydrogenase Eha subunit G